MSGPAGWRRRCARRDNIYDFAASLGVGASTVDSWDKRPDTVPRMKMQKALDHALEAAPCEVKQRFVELTQRGSRVRVSDSWGLDGNGADANRNQALKVILGLLGAAVVPQEVTERLLGDRAGQVGTGLLDSHERLARSLAADLLAGDARAVVPVASAHADDLLELWHRPAADQRRVEALVVGVNARTGLWAFHGGDLKAARQRLLLAWGLAAASGDPGLLAQAIGMTSVLSSTHSGCCAGDPERAVELLDHASALAVHADPHTRLWTAIWRADEAVAVGGIRMGQASMDAAGRARELLGDDPDAAGGRIGFVVYGLDQQLASVQANLSASEGRFADAEDRLAAVLRSAPTVRHQVLVLAQIARVRVRALQPEGACEALGAGLDLAEPAGYTMGEERIRGVRAGLPKPWAGLPCVRALDERLSLPTP